MIAKRRLQDRIPHNIGQYLYKNQAGALKKIFPKKTMKEIREMIGWL